MLLFSFGKCSLKFLYPIAAGIIWFCTKYISTNLFIESLNIDETEDYYYYSSFLLSILAQLGDIIIGLFYLLVVYRNRNNHIENAFCKEFGKSTKKYKSSYLIFALVTFLAIPTIGCNMILPTSSSLDNEDSYIQINFAIVVQFLIIVLLTTYLLKTPLHRHHYLGIGLVIFGFLIAILINLVIKFSSKNDNGISFSLVYLLYMVLISGVVAIIDVTTKWLMDNKYYTSLEIMFFQGIFGFIATLVVWLTISKKDNCPNDNEYIKMICSQHFTFNGTNITEEYYYSKPKEEMNFMFYSYKVILYTIGFLLSKGISHFFTLQTINHLGPTLKILANEVLMLHNAVSQLSISTKNSILLILVYIIIIIGVLMYNEFLIFHFCTLDFHTSKKIDERAAYNTDLNSISLIGYHEEEEEEDEEET